MFVDRKGVEISLLQWGRLREDQSYRIVRHSHVPTPQRTVIHISTVWHGLVPDWHGGDRAFGTAVMTPEGKFIEEIDQYDTEAEAIAGHREICERAHKGERLTPEH
jgi:hypothetical protein